MPAKPDVLLAARPTSTAYDNFDLKAEAAEATTATVRFAFHFPRLLDEFTKADREANQSRDRNRSLGALGVFLVLTALLYAATVPALHGIDHTVRTWAGLAAAGVGLLGTMLGLTGLRTNSRRHRWLGARLKTETLRLFHFNYMAARLSDINAAGHDAALQTEYVNAREAALERLLSTPLPDVREGVDEQISAGAASPFANVAEQDIKGTISPVLADFFAAWSVLRLDWQLRYANAKLDRTATSRKLSPLQQEHVFSTIGWTCVALLIVLHVAHLGEEFFPWFTPWLEIAVIWTALIALAARALEDGLRPQREVERYEQYRAHVVVARQRFRAATDAETRLEIMRGFEQVSLEEMRTFIRTHASAKYLL